MFSELLRRHRLAAGISQEQLAERARMSTGAVGSLERGTRRAPYRETVALLADALGLSGADRTAFEEAAGRARHRPVQPEAQSAPGNNIPIRLTSFIAREEELAAIKALLGTRRLVTVTGSGGVGKTSAALEVARELLEDGQQETWFVDLSSLVDGALVVDAVCAVLGTSAGAADDPATSLARMLKPRKMLLILDNCEHVVADARALAGAILRNCPQVTILATSRERLAIEGEYVYRIPSLAVPPASPASADEALTYASFRLFMDRATALDSHFQLDRERLPAAAEICRRLEGIPLAVELAATRAATLGLGVLNRQLEEHFAAGSAPRDVPQRQQTMLATIAWSYNLLSEAERQLLRRMAVFRGGIPLDAVEAVGGNLGLLTSLVEKSLVSPAPDEAIRFRMLEAVRAFALQQLRESAELVEAARAHATWLAHFAERSGSRRSEIPLSRWIRDVGMEIDNVRAALEWASTSDIHDDIALAARILSGLGPYWQLALLNHELSRWIAGVLERIDFDEWPDLASTLLYTQLLIEGSAERVAIAERDLPMLERVLDRKRLIYSYYYIAMAYAINRVSDAAQLMIARATALAEAKPEPDAQTYVNLMDASCAVHVLTGEVEKARRDLAEAKRRSEDTGFVDSTGRRLHWEGAIEFADGNMKRAASLFESVVDIQRAQTINPAVALDYLISARLVGGDVDGAVAVIKDLIEAVQADPDSMNTVYGHLATAATLRGLPESAARFMGFAMAVRARMKFEWTFISEACYEVYVTSLRTQLSTEQIEKLEAAGARLSTDQASEEALDALAQVMSAKRSPFTAP